MSALLQLQRRMAAAVMQPLSESDQMRTRNPHGRSNAADAREFIKPNSRLTSFERLEIYNRQYWFRILDSFAEDFPGLRTVVGSKKFDRLARAYLTECPSQSFTLRNLGSRLPQWLGQHRKYAGGRYSLAADMVALEWAHVEAFDAADLPPLTKEALARLGDDPKLTLQPHISLLEVQSPVDDLLLAVRKHGDAQQETGSNRAFPMRHWITKTSRNDASGKRGGLQGKRSNRGAVQKAVGRGAGRTRECIYIAVHRAGYSVHYRRLEREDYLLLTALRDGNTLGDALEAAFAGSVLAPKEQAARVQVWFSNWMSLGWFAAPAKGDSE